MSRTIKVQDIATTEPHRFIRAEISYNVGGLNYFTGSSMRRGYYLSVIPVKVKDGAVSFLAFSGTTQLIEEVKRFSLARLQEHAATVRQRPMYQTLVGHVVAKSNTTLAATTPPVAPENVVAQPLAA